MRCAYCGNHFAQPDGPPMVCERAWCSPTCRDAWWAENPEEAEGWIRVEDLSPIHCAELEALIGKGEPC